MNRHLGLGELLAGVADHQHRVGIGQQAEGGRQVRLPVAADPGGVDERQALLEQRAAGGDLDPQHLAATGFRRATQIVAEVRGWDRDHRGLGTVGRGHDQLCRHLLRIRHHRGDHCRLVVADPGHRHVEQRVEQLAFALLQLAGDHHADLGIGDAHPGLVEPLGQIPALVGLGDLAGVVDQLEDDVHLARVIRLRHGAPTVDAPTGGDRRTIPASCAMGLMAVDQNTWLSTWVSTCVSTWWCEELSSWLASTVPLRVVHLGRVTADELAEWSSSLPTDTGA